MSAAPAQSTSTPIDAVTPASAWTSAGTSLCFRRCP